MCPVGRYRESTDKCGGKCDCDDDAVCLYSTGKCPSVGETQVDKATSPPSDIDENSTSPEVASTSETTTSKVEKTTTQSRKDKKGKIKNKAKEQNVLNKEEKGKTLTDETTETDPSDSSVDEDADKTISDNGMIDQGGELRLLSNFPVKVY